MCLTVLTDLSYQSRLRNHFFFVLERAMVLANLTHVQKVRLLYKSCLKLHRGLPLHLKAIGDTYVRDEFRRHIKADQQQVQLFMEAWAVRILDQLVGTKPKSYFRNMHLTFQNNLGWRGSRLEWRSGSLWRSLILKILATNNCPNCTNFIPRQRSQLIRRKIPILCLKRIFYCFIVSSREEPK